MAVYINDTVFRKVGPCGLCDCKGEQGLIRAYGATFIPKEDSRTQGGFTMRSPFHCIFFKPYY